MSFGESIDERPNGVSVSQATQNSHRRLSSFQTLRPVLSYPERIRDGSGA
jgi:hypothetical protein